MALRIVIWHKFNWDFLVYFFVQYWKQYLKLFLAHFRECAREHQAVVLPAISPNLMKLSQFKGSTIKLKHANLFLFWLFPWVDGLLPQFLLVFTKEIASKWGKCLKLSKGLHRYCYILNKCMTQVSFNFIAGLSTNRDKYITVILNFSIHPNIW